MGRQGKSKCRTEKMDSRERGTRGRQSGREAPPLRLHIIYIKFFRKHETETCGMKSALWFVISELFSSLKAFVPTVRPIAKGDGESCKCNTAKLQCPWLSSPVPQLRETSRCQVKFFCLDWNGICLNCMCVTFVVRSIYFRCKHSKWIWNKLRPDW